MITYMFLEGVTQCCSYMRSLKISFDEKLYSVRLAGNMHLELVMDNEPDMSNFVAKTCMSLCFL